MGCSQSSVLQSCVAGRGSKESSRTVAVCPAGEDESRTQSSIIVRENERGSWGAITESTCAPEAEHPINWDLHFSDLKVEGHIASGAYCTVLACILNRECRAVKIPLANCSDPEGAIIDLENEIRILKRLRHPHLCAVYGGGGWQGGVDMPFLVLERLQYKNLAQQLGTDVDDTSIRMRLRQRRVRMLFPFRRRLQLGLQLAKLLKYLHR